MKKLTLMLAALCIVGATYACGGDKKACCKKGSKKECCKKHHDKEAKGGETSEKKA